MSAGAATQWFWSDWLGDQEVRRLSPAERGVWIDLLALAAAASPVGYVCDGKGRPLTLDEIARVVGASTEAVSELIAGILDKGVASRDRTGRLFNRRMVRDAAATRKKAEAGKLGGKATANKHWGKSHVLQHSLQQVPQQACYAPYLKESKNSPSPLTESERAEPPQAATEEASKGHPLQASAELAALEQRKARRGFG